MGSRGCYGHGPKLASVEDLAQEIQLILKAPPTDLREGWSLLKQGLNLLHARPKMQKKAHAREVVHLLGERPPNAERPTPNAAGLTLADLPILKCWPKDGGRFITLPNVHTRDPETGARNVGIISDAGLRRQTTGMHWQVHKVVGRGMGNVITSAASECRSRFVSAAIRHTPLRPRPITGWA